jgi:hypothetical protein
MKEEIEKMNKRTLMDKGEIKTEIKSPFSGEGLFMGKRGNEIKESGPFGKIKSLKDDDEYCTCTNCPKCGKKLRRESKYF